MSESTIYQFEKKYKLLTADLKNETPNMYKLAMLMICMSELERGFIVTKICKANKTGTKFKFTKIKDPSKLKDYILKLKEIHSEISTEEVINEIEKSCDETEKN